MNKIINNIKNNFENKNVLLVGTGGGNDIFSCLFVALKLFELTKPKKLDIAGMLSPAAIHYYDGKLESIINKLERNTNITRKLQDKNETEIKFVDNKFYEAVSYCKNCTETYSNHKSGNKKYNDFFINDAYHFSTLYGTERLSKEVNKLIAKNKYDVIIGVDVGGDILAGLHVDTVLSPIMDMTCLYVLGNTTIPSYILEFGYGTDGEAGNKSIFENIGMCYSSNIRCVDFIEDKIDQSYSLDIFNGVYEKILSTTRVGHTIPLFLKSCKSSEPKITSEHKYTYRIGEWEMIDKFDITLSYPYNKVYLFNAKSVYEKNSMDIKFNSPIKQALRFKLANSKWASEIDLHCLLLGEHHVLFGLVSSKFSNDQQEEMFDAILANLGKKYDFALVWRKDIESFFKFDLGVQCVPVFENGEDPCDLDVFLLGRNQFLIYDLAFNMKQLFS